MGEGRLMYGIGIYYALLNAIKAFRPEIKAKISAPMTPEKLLMMLYADAVTHPKLKTIEHSMVNKEKH